MSLNLKGKRVAVVGGRNFEDKKLLYEVLTRNRDRIKMIVSGDAEGADTLAVTWARDYGFPFLTFPPVWHDPDTGAYDKGAGFRRNRYIAEYSDCGIAFWDGKSRGTKNTIDIFKQLNKSMKIISFSPKVYAQNTTLEQWEKTKGGLCCSQPTCEHQEQPEHIVEALKAKGDMLSPEKLLEPLVRPVDTDVL
jgi:hypothetical protein